MYLANPATTEERARGIMNATSNGEFALRVKLLEMTLKGSQEIGHLNQHLLNLQEQRKKLLKSYQRCIDKSLYSHIIKIYGFTRDPESGDYILVMKYASEGDLQKRFKNITWNNQKLSILWQISEGLVYKILDGERPEITEDTPECYANLMKSCWDHDPKKRPSIKVIRKTFGRWAFRGENKVEFVQAEAKRKKTDRIKEDWT
ncbi:hypothetical protein C1646_662980 [Rhizophagus diaphanus]|nr:hypothetical protein C1646_662980 [Rhizophagus diaphanus] [Rhizophagus sp. MUCL 43196]